MIAISEISLKCKKVFNNASCLVTLLWNYLKKILLKPLSAWMHNTRKIRFNRITNWDV